MVFLAGPLNELRAMITGRFAITLEDDHERFPLPRERPR